MLFEPDEVRRLEDAELILLGVPPSDLAVMSLEMRADVLWVKKAHQAIEQGKLL